MRNLLFFIFFAYTTSFAQPASYTTANAHSHNDYQQTSPFHSAYNLQFGSIEVDVFLDNNELLVAHTAHDLPQHRTLEDLYLKPLQGYIQQNKGYAYADTSRKLQLMIDVKTEAVATLNKIIDVLMKYPELTKCKSLIILISGNKPEPSSYISYPSFIWFDGLLTVHYSKEALKRVAMLSDNFISYSTWKGNGKAPEKDMAALKKAVEKGHALKKTVRFWNVPDYLDTWQQLMEIGVDYINTDSIKALAQFLKQKGGKI
jgi:glycerophosphoryl diester phosphodiesterase